MGEIAGQTIEGPVDLAVSLHACDTATDDALAQAVAWQATVILAVPCCQHELARTIHVPELDTVAAARHPARTICQPGHRRPPRQALEACGYKTQVIEFIDLEHTAKNLLIRAVRRPRPMPAKAVEVYDQFKELLGLGSIASDRILAGSCETNPTRKTPVQNMEVAGSSTNMPTSSKSRGPTRFASGPIATRPA